MLFINLFAFLLGNLIVISAQTCYYPDGSVSSHDTPCHSISTGDGASACCGYSDICLDNGLCLAQSGAEITSRGGCTDETWQSPQCSQFCEDVNRSGGATVQLLQYEPQQEQSVFCCSPFNIYNNTCLVATKGSHAPFYVEAGKVIFNRTSGSTSPNITSIAPVTITVTATATTTATISPSAHRGSSSSKRETVTGAVVGAVLGSGLLVMLALLWRERRHKQNLKKDVQTWKGKYGQLMETQNVLVDVSGANHQPPQQLESWNSIELHGLSHLPHQNSGEIDGTPVA